MRGQDHRFTLQVDFMTAAKGGRPDHPARRQRPGGDDPEGCSGWPDHPAEG
jgi:hypothetical protein